MESINHFTDAEQLHKWIENDLTPTDKVVLWLNKLLYFEEGYPSGFERAEYIDVVRAVYARDNNFVVRKKMQEALFILVRTANWDDNNVNYLDKLLYLVGYFSALVNSISTKFFTLLRSEHLKSKLVCGRRTLHNTLLQAIEGAGYAREMLPYIRRDLNDINYSMISYSILCKYEPKEAIICSSKVASIFVFDHPILLNYIFEKQLNSLGIDDRYVLAKTICDSDLTSRKKDLAFSLPCFEPYYPRKILQRKIIEQYKQDEDDWANNTLPAVINRLLSPETIKLCPSLVIEQEI